MPTEPLEVTIVSDFKLPFFSLEVYGSLDRNKVIAEIVDKPV